MRYVPFILTALLATLAACDDPDVAGAWDASTEVADGATLDAALPPPDGALDGGLDAKVELDASLGAPEASLADAAPARDATALPYARGVESFREGTNAGFGSEKYPDVVLGPPQGGGTNAGSLDVLSLGVAGEIVLDLGARAIVDGDGPDFIVFENPFWPGGSVSSVFAELGEVSVSDDLTSWLTFPCSTQAVTPGVFPGCAGWTPALEYDPFAVVPLDPARTGGDAFDLRTVAATRVRYVRIRDLSTTGQGQTAGFDLDAIGVIHAAE